MRRRRPLRRPPLRRPLRRRPPLPPRLEAARRQLQQAHRLMDEEKYDEAAPIFAELAQEAGAAGALERAARLHLQAGRAYLEAEQLETALEHARRGLAQLARSGRPGRAASALKRAADELRQHGYEQEADELVREFEEKTGRPLTDWLARAGSAPKRRTLPDKCAACGAPLRPDEVEWLDEFSAECAFCGAVAKTQAVE